MPIYEYRCPEGHLFEVFHGMTEDGPTGCEICGQSPLQRVLHPVAVHYKGSGFYSTDYGRKGRQASKDGTGEGGGGTGGDGGASSGDTKSSPGSGSEGGSKKPAAGGDGKKSSDS
jgi:putative FmdB family regulatory protein